MALISELEEKLASEVEPDNLMAIEDAESTKKIKIKSLMEVFRPVQECFVKEIINDTIDRIIERLADAKWEFVDYVTKKYLMNTWIGSASGNIQIALLDMEQDKWLTRDEIEELFSVSEELYSIRVMIGRIWEEPVSMRILSFCEEHENPEEINAWMAADDAGFLKIHFDGLTNNQISQIIYEDVEIKMESEDENTRYEFIYSRDSFANSVPYEARVPGCCPCCSNVQKPKPEEPKPDVPVTPEPEPEVPDTPTDNPDAGDGDNTGEDNTGGEESGEP